jgi:hypothetical protein
MFEDWDDPSDALPTVSPLSYIERRRFDSGKETRKKQVLFIE